MNHPTREEFEQLKEQVKRIEQKTEEIKTVKVEVASKDVLDRLDNLEAGQQRLEQNQSTHFEVMVKTVEDSASQLREILASKEDLAAMEARIITTVTRLLEPKSNGH